MGYITKSGILMWEHEIISATPDVAGVYVLRDFNQSIIYIGSAGSGRLRERLLEHWRSSDIPEVRYFDWYQTADTRDARSLENTWIRRYQPRFNDVVAGYNRNKYI